jgi:hypothetical protein
VSDRPEAEPPLDIENAHELFEKLRASVQAGVLPVVAPKTRKKLMRPLRTESGELVHHDDVIRGLLKQAGIEAEVLPGKKKGKLQVTTCRLCQKLFRCGDAKNNIYVYCRGCRFCACGNEKVRPASSACTSCITAERKARWTCPWCRKRRIFNVSRGCHAATCGSRRCVISESRATREKRRRPIDAACTAEPTP